MGQTDFAPVFLIIKVEYEIRKPFADSSLKFTPAAHALSFASGSTFWTNTVRSTDENRTLSHGSRLNWSARMPEDLVLTV